MRQLRSPLNYDENGTRPPRAKRALLRAATAGATSVALLVTGLGYTAQTASAAPLKGTLNGSGSTFQLSFQQSAIAAFRKIQKGITVNYGGGGSGKGRSDLISKVVQFCGTDSVFSAKEAAAAKGTLLYFPVIIGPITMSYNLPGVKLKLTPAVISGIFQAKIKKWNAAQIKAINPGAKLPNLNITVARRSDSSGTTQNFSQFLVRSAPGSWKLGTNSTINWPSSSVGGNGNGGVAAIISKTKGAIGYVDFADAKAAKLKFASVKNKAGKFVAPSAKAASAAADKASVKPNLTFSAIWAPGAAAYPITYQSWVVVRAKQPNAKTAALLKAWIGYLIGPGQNLLGGLGYARLPAGLQAKDKAQLSKIKS